jgi:predicted transcriptional regulator YheO
MKVHRIIAIIEVENDNSITSVEVTNLHLTNNDIPLAVTNITTNGNANDIEQVYKVIDDYRLVIRDKLKSIARSINDGLDDYKCGIICINAYDDKYDDETETDGLI